MRARDPADDEMLEKRAAIVPLMLLAMASLPRSAPAADTPAKDAGASAFVAGLLEAFAASAPTQRTPITLGEAVVTAVANNPGVLAQRREPESAAFRVLGAEAVYEPKIRIDFAYADRKIPTSDLLQGVEGEQLGDAREDDEYVADIALSKTLRTGTEVELLWQNARRTTNSSFEAFSPSFQPSVGVGVAQPLLRDFGGMTARTTVELAEKTSFRTAADYEAALAAFVLEVVEAYWRYNLAEAELAAKQRSFELAKELATEARARVEIGSLPPVAAKEAESDAATRDEEVIAARNDLELSARALQYKIMLGGARSAAPAAVRPGEAHAVEAVPLDPATSLARAVEERAEARAARLEIDSAKIDEKLARNLLLPSLDLVGRYDIVGLGGRDNPDFAPPGGGTVDPSGRSESDAFGDSYDVLETADFFRYRIGVQLEVPFSNAEARSRHAQATIAVRRAEDALRATVSDIALDIQQAIGDVESAYKRVAAARLARELAEQNLNDQKKRYEVGIVTTTDILDFQEKATNAMAAEARAIADHATAIAELQRAEGSLLPHYGIRVELAGRPGNEWWSRF